MEAVVPHEMWSVCRMCSGNGKIFEETILPISPYSCVGVERRVDGQRYPRTPEACSIADCGCVHPHCMDKRCRPEDRRGSAPPIADFIPGWINNRRAV